VLTDSAVYYQIQRIGHMNRKKRLALLLSLAMLLGLGGTAWADPVEEKNPPAIVVIDNGDDLSVKVEGADGRVPEGDTITDAKLTDTGAEPTVTVNGSEYHIVNADEATAFVQGDVTGGSVSTNSSGEGNIARVEVNGSITNPDGIAVQATSTDTGFDDPGEGDRIIVRGSVTGGTTAIKTESNQASVEVVVLDNVKGGETGIETKTANGGVTTVDVYGNVDAGVTGIDASGSGNTGETETHIYINGNVSSEYGMGIHAASDKGDSWTSVIVEKNVSGNIAGVFAEGDNSTGTNVAVGGNITGDTGIVVDNTNSRVTIDVVGLDGGVTLNLEETHNVTATTAGIEIKQSDVEENGHDGTQITVDGVLSVEEGGTPILLGNAVSETDVGNISITVWKIEGQGEDNIVSGGGEGAASALQSSIRYIIKIADDEDSKRVFGGHYQDGDTLTEGEHEIMLTVPDGFEITSAYATDGTEVPILKGSDGQYYAVIPRGGGILLNASLRSLGGFDFVNLGFPAASVSSAGSFVGGLCLADGKYMLTLTTRERTMTFVRSTLERFARLNDIFLVSTPHGCCEVSLSELLSFNEKAVNFRFDLIDGAVEIYVNGELARRIGLEELALV
jgi:hypothetical protein